MDPTIVFGVVVACMFILIVLIEWIKTQIYITLASAIAVLFVGSGIYLSTVKEQLQQNP